VFEKKLKEKNWALKSFVQDHRILSRLQQKISKFFGSFSSTRIYQNEFKRQLERLAGYKRSSLL
jgi:hypothetical protein